MYSAGKSGGGGDGDAHPSSREPRNRSPGLSQTGGGRGANSKKGHKAKGGAGGASAEGRSSGKESRGWVCGAGYQWGNELRREE